MSNQKGQSHKFVVMLGLLVGGVVLMYLGRAAIFYGTSSFAAGIFGVAIAFNGGDTSIVLEGIHREPTLREQIFVWTGFFAFIIGNVGVLRGGRDDK